MYLRVSSVREAGAHDVSRIEIAGLCSVQCLDSFTLAIALAILLASHMCHPALSLAPTTQTPRTRQPASRTRGDQDLPPKRLWHAVSSPR